MYVYVHVHYSRVHGDNQKQDLLVDMFFAMGYDDVLIDAQLVIFDNV